MTKQIRRPARVTDRSTSLPASGLVRAGRALSLASALLSLGSQFAPLGDNRLLLAVLTARVRAARDYGA